jgi:hypothetical protein
MPWWGWTPIATSVGTSTATDDHERELNARTDIGDGRWSIPRLHDLLTVHTARLLHHPPWKEIKRATHRPSTIPFRLQKFGSTALHVDGGGVVWERQVDGSAGEHDGGQGGLGTVEAVGAADDQPDLVVQSFLAAVR